MLGETESSIKTNLFSFPNSITPPKVVSYENIYDAIGWFLILDKIIYY